MTSVQRSLTRISGVTRANANLEKAEAVVTFDDTKTNIEALRKATGGAGYPSTLKQERK